jgi:hypothetical protein
MLPKFDGPAYDFTRCEKCKHQRTECLPPDDGGECPAFDPEDDG